MNYLYLRNRVDLLLSGDLRDSSLIANEIGWSKELASLLDPWLAKAILAAKQSELEGVPIPVVLTLPPSKLLLNAIDSASTNWEQFVEELKRDVVQILDPLSTNLANGGNVVSTRLHLAPSVALSLDSTAIEEAVRKSADAGVTAALNEPGSLELDQAGITASFAGLAEEFGLTGIGQSVAVIDGPVQTSPGLRDRVIRGGNFSDSGWDDAGIADSLARDHATLVAGIIAGSGLDSSGQSLRIGIAPKATITNYKIAPLAQDGARVAAAIEQACFDGQRIVNLSWGQSRASIDATSVWARTVDAAFSRGMLTIKSAGNNGPAVGSITTPADAHYVLSVGACDRFGDQVHDKSAVGPTSDGRQKPDVVAPGGGMIVPGTAGKPVPTPTPGTSFAAPVVSGICALVLEREPGLSVSDLRARIIRACTLIASSPTERQGAGLVSARRALFQEQ